MDENSAAIEAILREDEFGTSKISNDHGWKTVTYKKSSRKTASSSKAPVIENFADHHSDGEVFRSIEQHSDERIRRALEAQKAAIASVGGESSVQRNGDDDDDGSDDGLTAAGVENGGGEVKKVKPKKVKKPKVTVAEASAKMNDSDLAVFLADITASYETQQDIQLMRFADYFGRAFASVSGSQFPWMKTLKESSVAKMVDIPLSHVPEAIYRTSVEWLNKRSVEALGSFVLWSLDSIFAELAIHQGASKGSKKLGQQAYSKSQVAIFVVLAMVLRRKPDVLISLLTIVKENPKYQGQDKLPILVWTITQACQEDLAVGLFMWANFLLPIVTSKSCNPQSRDLILQLVERIISSPKARTILVNGAVRKGERLVPPSALELLMRATFPAPSLRVKATERFEAVYPLLKEVALAISPGSKAMKQLTRQIMYSAANAAREGNSALVSEASDIFIWCLIQNPDCFKQWDKIYLDNLEASGVVLRKLSDEWKVHCGKHEFVEPLKVALKSFVYKNGKGLASDDVDAAQLALLKDAEKQCKMLYGRLSRGYGCMTTMMLFAVGMALGTAYVTQDPQSWNLKKLRTLKEAGLKGLPAINGGRNGINDDQQT